MSNTKAKPTFLDIGDSLHIKRRNLAGWHREEPTKIKLFLVFKEYGLHNEWMKGTEDEMDEIEEDLLELRENNML